MDLSGARSQQVLRVFGYGLLAAILLLVPAFPATSLVREKMKGTLALLLNSPMTPWSIYIGKLGGVLGFTLILLVMTAPAAAACHALGGGTTAQGGIAALYGVSCLSPPCSCPPWRCWSAVWLAPPTAPCAPPTPWCLSCAC